MPTTRNTPPYGVGIGSTRSRDDRIARTAYLCGTRKFRRHTASRNFAARRAVHACKPRSLLPRVRMMKRERDSGGINLLMRPTWCIQPSGVFACACVCVCRSDRSVCRSPCALRRTMLYARFTFTREGNACTLVSHALREERAAWMLDGTPFGFSGRPIEPSQLRHRAPIYGGRFRAGLYTRATEGRHPPRPVSLLSRTIEARSIESSRGSLPFLLACSCLPSFNRNSALTTSRLLGTVS